MKIIQNEYEDNCTRYYPLAPAYVDFSDYETEIQSAWIQNYLVVYPENHFKVPAMSINITYLGKLDEMKAIRDAIDLAITELEAQVKE